MIYYLVRAAHSYTMELFLGEWDSALDELVEVVPYENQDAIDTLPPGTYIFSDLERLNAARTQTSAMLWERLQQAGRRVLNHPGGTMNRYELLRTLYQSGENAFNVYRLSETRRPNRFPVILRQRREHAICSRLLRTQDDLDAALSRLAAKRDINKLLMVEFCDTSDSAGLFRMYSAFYVSGRVIPRHLFFSRRWKVKGGDLSDEDMRQEEWTYLMSNPHEAWIRRMFQLARVDYGKIDYSFLGNTPQVWEINTNPLIVMPIDMYKEGQMPVQRLFADRIGRAFEELDSDPARLSVESTVSSVTPASWSPFVK